MAKHSTQSKLRVLKIYISDLETGKRPQVQPDWLKQILNNNEASKRSK